MPTDIPVSLLSGLRKDQDGLPTDQDGLSEATNVDFSLPGELRGRELGVGVTGSVISKGRDGSSLLTGLESLASLRGVGCATHGNLPCLITPGSLYTKRAAGIYGAGAMWSVIDETSKAVGGSQEARVEAVNVGRDITGFTSGYPNAYYAAVDGTYPVYALGTTPPLSACASRGLHFRVEGANVILSRGFPTTTEATLGTNFTGTVRGLWAVDCGTYTVLAYSILGGVQLLRVSDAGTILSSSTVSTAEPTSAISVGYNPQTNVAVLCTIAYSATTIRLVHFVPTTLSVTDTALVSSTYGQGMRDCAIGCSPNLPAEDRWRVLIQGFSGYVEIYQLTEGSGASLVPVVELSQFNLGSNKYNSWSILFPPTNLCGKLVFGVVNHVAEVGSPPSVSFTPDNLGTWMVLDTYSMAVVGAGDEGTCCVTTQGSSAIRSQDTLTFGVQVGDVFNNGVITHSRAVAITLKCRPPVTASANGLTYFSGLVPYAFDGDAVFPAGFVTRPSTRCVAGSGGSLAAGSYTVQATWAFVDGLGNQHESAPSDKITLTVGASGTIAFTINGPPWLYPECQANIYITVVNPSQNAGLYRIATVRVPNTLGTSYTISSIPGGDALALPPLYTNGGILENNRPTASRGIISAGERLWCSDGQRVLASKLVSSREGVSWSYLSDDSLVIVPPPSAGSIRGLGAIDDIVYLFCDNSVLVMSGSGPPDTGGVSDFDSPRETYRVAGPLEPSGVCGTPTGVAWSSLDGGIHVVNAAGQGSTVGNAIGGLWGRVAYVPPTLDTSGRLVSARLMCLEPSGNSVAVYSLTPGLWSVYMADATTTDLAVSDGVCYYTQTDAAECWAYYDRSTRHPTYTIATLLRELGSDGGVYSVSPVGRLISGAGSIVATLIVDSSRQVAATKTINLALDGTNPPRTGLFKWTPAKPHCVSFLVKLEVTGDVQLSSLILGLAGKGTNDRKTR